MILRLWTAAAFSLGAKFITTTSSRLRRGAKHLEPIINERLRCMETYGEGWTNRPVGALFRNVVSKYSS